VVTEGNATNASGQAVLGGYYATLGISPAIGRWIEKNDDRSGAAPVAMISYRFWQSQFGGDPGVLGKPITIRNVPSTIIGVEPGSFLGLTAGENPDVIVPLHRLADLGKEWNDPDSPIFTATDYWWLRIAVRLNAGVSQDRAQAELSALFQQGLPKVKLRRCWNCITERRARMTFAIASRNR